MEHETRKAITHEDRQSLVGINKKLKAVESILVLEDYLFREFIERKRSEDCFYDVVFNLRNECEIRSNRALLSPQQRVLQDPGDGRLPGEGTDDPCALQRLHPVRGDDPLPDFGLRGDFEGVRA